MTCSRLLRLFLKFHDCKYILINKTWYASQETVEKTELQKVKRSRFKIRGHQKAAIRPYRLHSPSVMDIDHYPEPIHAFLLCGISTLFRDSIFCMVTKERGGKADAPPPHHLHLQALSCDMHKLTLVIPFPLASDWLRKEHKNRKGQWDLNKGLL